MNKLAKASIIKGRALNLRQDTRFEGYPLSYPVDAVKKCHYDVKVERIGDYAHATFTISATLTVRDSRDNVPFDDKVVLKEDIDILDEEDSAGEGFVVSGGDIDLDELALRIIVSSLPIRLVRNETIPLPKSGKGYRFLTEEDSVKEKEAEGDPRLAALKDFKVDK